MTGPWSGLISKTECSFLPGFSEMAFCHPPKQCDKASTLTVDYSLCSLDKLPLKGGIIKMDMHKLRLVEFEIFFSKQKTT